MWSRGKKSALLDTVHPTTGLVCFPYCFVDQFAREVASMLDSGAQTSNNAELQPPQFLSHGQHMVGAVRDYTAAQRIRMVLGMIIWKSHALT